MMNIMCIIIYSPSATNTATESYMTTYSINAKSKALKQKKKPVFLKRTLTYAEKTVFFFFFSFSPSFSKSKQLLEAISIQQSSDESEENP